MLPSAFSNSPESLEPREFEQLIQDGIAAVKIGDLAMAKRLLEQAALSNSGDARIWIWLSATTEDLEERRTYLEKAVAAEPSNSMAKRGLMLINEKLDKARLMPEGEAYTPQKTPSLDEAKTRTYSCPNCGATISYDPNDISLVCQFCGFTRKIDASVVSESTDKPLDETLPSTPAHRWAENQARVTCEQCGAVIILPPGQTADRCPYCASTRFITTSSIREMIDPQAIGLFKVDPEKAGTSVKTWLGKGLLSPDNLAAEHAGTLLEPAYYPFWIFDGTLELPWFCDVNVGTGKAMEWEAHTGSHFENFKDILIPGLRKMSSIELAGIEPFDLSELVEFSPDHLAGWVALTYDIPLADASLRARDVVIKKVRSVLPSIVEPGHSKRNFSIGTGRWSGLTYKLALLPIYVGNYPFQGKIYRLLVNGQTGKVSGKKPLDTFKLAMFAIAGFIILAIVVAILLVLGNLITG